MKELSFDASFHDGHLVFYSFFLQVKLTCRHTLIIWQFDILDWQVNILVWQVGIIIYYWLTFKMMMQAFQKVVLACQFFMWTYEILWQN